MIVPAINILDFVFVRFMLLPLSFFFD